MRILFLITTIIVLPLTLHAQLQINNGESAKSSSLGFASNSLTGIHAINNNQAGLARVQNFEALFSTEQRFGIEQLNHSFLAISKRILSDNIFGLFISSYGIDALKQQQISLSYARSMSQRLNIGLAFDLFLIDAKEYGKSNNYTINAGIQYELNDRFLVGLHITNPVKSSVNENSEIVSSYDVGLKYVVTNKVDLYAQVEKVSGYNVSAAFGIDYEIHQMLRLRVGASSAASTIHFGMAIPLSDQINLEGSAYRHPSLGLTPGLSVNYAN